MIRRPPRSTLFPTRRSSDLAEIFAHHRADQREAHRGVERGEHPGQGGGPVDVAQELALVHAEHADRKSTRLNSSHANISHAVFCLTKKNHDRIRLYSSLPLP